MSEHAGVLPDEEPPFLGSDPPPLVARGLSTLLIGLFVTAMLFAVLVKIPETVSVTFVLVPFRGADPVRAPRTGSVVEALVRESSRVEKGAGLFVLRSPGAADRSTEVQTALGREAGAAEALANARRKYEADTLAAEKEMNRLLERPAFLGRMLELKKEQLALTREQSERARKLNEQGLASLEQQSDAQIRHSQTAMEFEQLKTDWQEAQTAVEKLRLSEDSRRAAFREEERGLTEKLREATIKSAALRAEVAESTGGEVTIAAPCDGTVLRLEVRSPGTVVLEGDTLASVACSGDRLQAELTLSQGGLSRIRPGQSVKLLYDAFPYQRYGAKAGIVRWASPAAVPEASRPASAAGDAQGPASTDGSVFRAFADLADQTIRVDGEDRPYMPGMKGTALVVVGRRSVVSYAFEPLSQLREKMR